MLIQWNTKIEITADEILHRDICCLHFFCVCTKIVNDFEKVPAYPLNLF